MNETPNWWGPLIQASKANGVPLTKAASVAEIFHDDGCARLKGTGVCDCDPDVKLASKRLEEGES
jgi:hypothetical protein